MNKPFDPQWVEQAINGDSMAITELYNCSWHEVCTVIRSMIPRDEDTVQDLAQDTFVKAFRRLDQLGDPAKYKAWIKQIARNTARDHQKKSKAVLFSELNSDDSIPLDFEDEDLSHLPEVVIDQQDTARILQEMLESLSDKQRTIFTMHYVEGISIKEISTALGMKEDTVKSHLYKARENLKKKLYALEEKEGIKLYSVSPVAFLLLLLRNMEGLSAQPDPALLGNILQSASTAAGGAAAGTATGGAAAKAAGGIAAKKIIAGVLAAATLAGGAAGIAKLTSQPDYPEKDLFLDDYRVTFIGENGSGIANVYSLDGYGLDTSIVPCYDLSNGDVVTLTLSAPDGGDLEDYCKAHYGFTPMSDSMEYTVVDLLDPQAESAEESFDYEQLVIELSSFIHGEIPIDQAGIDLSWSALQITPAGCSLDENGFFVYRRDVRYSFALFDINNDGTKELITLEVSQDSEDDLDGAILDIFTFRNGEPVWLIAGAERTEIILCENGIIHEQGSGGEKAIGHCFYEIIEGELVLRESAQMDWGTFYVNGAECSEDLFWFTVDKYRPIMKPDLEWICTIEK